jgi:ion channel-forming bestrophin family protein
MKAYNPKHWFSLIFSFHKTDSFRQLLPGMGGLIILSAFLCYLDLELKCVAFRSTTVMHSLLGFVISLLLVFRTNTAYERWWEGRKLFGDLVNNSRNLMMKYNAFIPESHKALKNNFRIHISNYAFAVKEHLRGGFIQEQLEEHPELRLSELKEFSHVPNRIASQLYIDSEKLVSEKIISEEKLIIINDELRSFTNMVGACERIKKTPIPYSYSSFIKRMIFLYVITLPLGLIHDLKWATIPIVLFVFYAFASLELIAEEIEDPFGHEQNDLPTDEIAGTIKKNLVEIIK